MRIVFYLCFLVFPAVVFSQQKREGVIKYDSQYNSTDSVKKQTEKIATFDLYKVITIDNDTTYIDTSLTIQKEYSHNYLRKDIFGLLPFANDGDCRIQRCDGQWPC